MEGGPVTIKVVETITCPRCGATELDPKTAPDGKWVPGAKFQIRAFKVEMGDGHWWSECLVCKENGREAWF